MRVIGLTTRGGQRRYSGLAITTALLLRAAIRLALRQTLGCSVDPLPGRRGLRRLSVRTGRW